MAGRLALVAVALLVAAGLGWMWWTSDAADDAVEPAGAATAMPATGTVTEPSPQAPAVSADEAREETRTPLVEEASGTADAAAPGTAVVVGRVVDGRRSPVAGATVTVEMSGESIAHGTSEADGRFRIPGLPRPPQSRYAGFVRATDDAGRVAFRRCWIPALEDGSSFAAPVPIETEIEIDVDVLVLEDAHDVHVRVFHGGSALPGARVTARALAHVEGELAAATSDEQGLAVLEGLPATWLFFEAAAPGLQGEVTATIPVPPRQELTIDVSERRTVEVLVLDATTGEGIPAAEVLVRRGLSVPAHQSPFATSNPMRGEYSTNAIEKMLEGTTDESGRATFPGVSPGGRFEARAEKDGYARGRPPWRNATRLRPGETSLTLELEPEPRRTVRWPIVGGEVVPPTGTPLEIAATAPGFWDRSDDLPVTGTVRDGHVVVDELPARPLTLLAHTPDGAVARLHARPDEELGPEVSFRRARTIEIIVHDTAGAPVVGAVAQARDHGNRLLGDWATTDAEGRARIDKLLGGRADVWVAAPGDRSRGELVGTVDLEEGDARLEVTLGAEEERVALLFVRLEGEPGLPAHYELYAARRSARVLEENPARGELRFEVPAHKGDTFTAGLRADGYVTGTVEFSASPAGTLPTAILDLMRARTLIATVVPPDEGRTVLQAERWDEEKEGWVEALQRQGIDTPNGPGGSYVFPDLETGRHRVVETRSKFVSEEVVLEGLVYEARVHMDLRGRGPVTGRIEAPPGTDLSLCTVFVEGEGIAEIPEDYLSGFDPPRGSWVRDDGTFELQVAAGKPVTLRPWHPWLTPASAGGTVLIDGPREGVVLRLVAGAEVRIPLRAISTEDWPKSVRVLRYGGDPEGPPLKVHHVPVRDGVGRFGGVPSGTWTLWIDPGRSYAPLTLRGVEVGPGVTTLAEPRFTAGSTVRIHVLVAEGQDCPRLHAAAQPRDEPGGHRQLSSHGEVEFLLPGLGAGRYSLQILQLMGLQFLPAREIEVDGETDLDITLDLR